MMRWEAGTSASLVLGSININDLDITLHLRDSTCPIRTMRVTGSANAHIKSNTLPTKGHYRDPSLLYLLDLLDLLYLLAQT